MGKVEHKRQGDSCLFLLHSKGSGQDCYSLPFNDKESKQDPCKQQLGKQIFVTV